MLMGFMESEENPKARDIRAITLQQHISTSI